MRAVAVVVFTALFATPVAAAGGPNVIEAFGRLPLRFEPDSPEAEAAGFKAAGPRHLVTARADGVVFSLLSPDGSIDGFRLTFPGASPNPPLSGEGRLPGVTNYLVGLRPEWRTRVPGFRGVRYSNAYPGVDVVFYGTDRDIEFDFVVAPGANPAPIAMRYEGARVSVDEVGDLRLELTGGTVRQRRPVAYQEKDGQRVVVPVRYVLTHTGDVRLELGAYDADRPLVIDPVIAYSTYFGGGGWDEVMDVAVDADGFTYITGFTSSLSLHPVNALQPNNATRSPSRPTNDMFVAKLTPDGSALVYSTLLGGTDGDVAYALAVDAMGHVYVAGTTSSPTFPTTESAYDRVCSDGALFNDSNGVRNATCRVDVVLSKLSPDGSALLYSTFVGGRSHDQGEVDVAVDASGVVYLLGQTESSDLPLLTPPFAPGGPSFLAKIDTTASGPLSLVYSLRLGPAEFRTLAIDAAGHAYVAGRSSGSFPIRKGYQTTRRSTDAVLARIDTSRGGADALVYSTFHGGSAGEIATGVVIDDSGRAYITGETNSSNLPLKHAFQASFGGQLDAFAAVIDTTAEGEPSLLYSSYLGGSGSELGHGIDLQPEGQVVIVGTTSSADFPLRVPLQAGPGQLDTFVATFDTRRIGDESLTFSSYFGGESIEERLSVAVDSTGAILLAGDTVSPLFPVAGAIQPQFGGGQHDGFVAKLAATRSDYLVSAVHPAAGGAGGLVTATVYGAGFVMGAAVELRRGGEGPIRGEATTLIRSGTLITRFDLTGAAAGAWDVAVINPDGGTAVLREAFTVNPTATIRGSASVNIGPQRHGRPMRGYITYSNPGDVDVLLPIYLTVRKGLSVEFTPPMLHQSLLPGSETTDYSALPRSFDSGTHTVIPVIVYVPAGASGVIPIRLPEGCDPTRGNEIVVTTGAPMSPNDAGACLAAFASLAFNFVPGAECVKFVAQLATKGLFAYAGQPVSLSSWIADGLLGAVQCAVSVVPAAQVIKSAALLAETLVFANEAADAISPCTMASPRPGARVSRAVSCVFSADPNAKYGPAGAGEREHIRAVDPLAYSVSFENVATASAPAQDVVVTDQLDASRFDLSTFALGPMIVGDLVVTPPLGLKTFTEDVDLRPARNLILRIDAGVDLATGLASWRFASLDPGTMQPTEDPLAGFLPPNVTSPEGEGTVFFTIQAADGLGTGDEIRNDASIVFDVNAPIVTNEWLNTIDRHGPSSAVAPLPAQSPVAFQVSWSGQDAGAGVDVYSVYVSENGGPFTLWIAESSGTSAEFTGRPGSTYGFFSLARDLVGNEEPMKASADTLTEIIADVEPPVTTAAASPEPNAAGWNSGPVTVTLSATDAMSGVREIRYSAAGATTIGQTTVAGGQAVVPLAAEGTTVLTFLAVDRADNSEAAQTLTVRIDATPPVVSVSRTPEPNASGWNSGEVHVRFTAMDPLSGIAGDTVAEVVFSTEGAGQGANRTFMDAAGNIATASVTGINIDLTPPVVVCTASPGVIWPPNHQMVRIAVEVGIHDALSGGSGFVLLSATSSETGGSEGDGRAGADIQDFTVDTPDVEGAVRAERSGGGPGRIYSLVYRGADRAGLTASCTATVSVPHDRSRRD